MIEIYGHSDDLIEIEGDIREEFTAYEYQSNFLILSNGTILKIKYNDEGCWEIREVVKGEGPAVHSPFDFGGEPNYSDRYTILGPVKWVAHATSLVVAK